MYSGWIIWLEFCNIISQTGHKKKKHYIYNYIYNIIYIYITLYMYKSSMNSDPHMAEHLNFSAYSLQFGSFGPDQG